MTRVLCALMMVVLSCAVLAGTRRQFDLDRIGEHVRSRGSEPWTWVFYGDSITHGARHTYGWRSFPEIFHERVRGEYLMKNEMVINSGASGYSTFELLSENFYHRMVRRFHPQVVFLLIGINDIVHPKCGGVEGFRQRLETLVKRIQDDEAIVVLQTYPTIQLVTNPTQPHHQGYIQRFHELQAFNDVIRDTAEKFDAILVDHEAYWKRNSLDSNELDSWRGDPIHPGAKGHLEMARLILQTLNLYDSNSTCCQVAAGGQAPTAATALGERPSAQAAGKVVFRQDFDTDFEIGPLPQQRDLAGGSWRTANTLSGGIVAEGVNGSKCLKVMRDGEAGIGIFRLGAQLSDNQDYQVSFKVKLAPDHGVALQFVRYGKGTIGGVLLFAGKDAQAYDAASNWTSCATNFLLPANEFIECRIRFNAAQKQYVVTLMDRNQTPHAGKGHPYLAEFAADEIRFFNILPQKCYSLIDDVEVSVF